MPTAITDITGRPFSKEVQAEFERRKGLEQTFDNSSELYQPYFILRKLNNLNKILDTRKATEDDYSDDDYSKLGHVFSDDKENQIDYDFGLNRMLDTEFRGLVGITDVSIELKDFAFYVATVNFEINDIQEFRKFKNTWFNFGIPVEMEFGRYSPLNETINSDINPNKEKRVGVIVKFDYQLQDSGRGASGTFKIYSTTWLSVLREGNSDDKDVESYSLNLKNLFEDYHDVKVEEYKQKEANRSLKRISSTGTITNFVERTDNYGNDTINDYILAYIRRDIDVNILPLSGHLTNSTGTTNFSVNFNSPINSAPTPNRELENYKIYTNVIQTGDIDFQKYDLEKRILSSFTLDPEIYNSPVYYYFSFRSIEDVINNLYIEDSTIMNEINRLKLTGVPINNKNVKGGLKSIDFEDVLINPKNKRYDGQYMSDDIYISVVKLFNLIDNSTGIHSFLENLLSLVSQNTLGNVDLRKVILDIYDESEVATKGITFYDNNYLDITDEPYTTFDIHNPVEKLQNMNIATEISENIATMIFFNAYGNDNPNRNTYKVREDFNEWVHIPSDMLYNYYYKKDEPRLKTTKIGHDLFKNAPESAKSNRDKKRSEDYQEDLLEYREKYMEEVQKRKTKAIRKFYKNTYRNFTQSLQNLKNDQSEFLINNKFTSSKEYNVALIEYLYYKMYLEITTRKQQFEIAMDGTQLKQFPLSCSFDVNGITGILPTQAFKIKFESFPIQYNLENGEIVFVVNSLNHSFQGNDWTTSIGGLMYVNPSSTVGTNIESREKQIEDELQKLKKIFVEEIKELTDYDEEMVRNFKKKINIDS